MTTTVDLYGNEFRMYCQSPLGEQIIEAMEVILQHGNPTELLQTLQKMAQETGCVYR
jgi:uncharacterized protein YihD (DUF1040 family)